MEVLDLVNSIISRANSKSSVSLAGWVSVPFIPPVSNARAVVFNLREYVEQNPDKIEWLFTHIPTFQLRIYSSRIFVNIVQDQLQHGVTLFLPSKRNAMRWKLIK